MEKTKPIKPSDELYGEGPESWMFLPYYLAVEYKRDLADSMLAKELDVHYMEQDSAAVSREYSAREFNAGLLSEMDREAHTKSIPYFREMLDEMKEAYEQIRRKYEQRS